MHTTNWNVGCNFKVSTAISQLEDACQISLFTFWQILTQSSEKGLSLGDVIWELLNDVESLRFLKLRSNCITLILNSNLSSSVNFFTVGKRDIINARSSSTKSDSAGVACIAFSISASTVLSRFVPVRFLDSCVDLDVDGNDWSRWLGDDCWLSGLSSESGWVGMLESVSSGVTVLSRNCRLSL